MSSKRAVRRKVCGTKVQYDTHESANAAARKMMGVENRGIWINAYKCKFCGKWHIGHFGMPKYERIRGR